MERLGEATTNGLKSIEHMLQRAHAESASSPLISFIFTLLHLQCTSELSVHFVLFFFILAARICCHTAERYYNSDQ